LGDGFQVRVRLTKEGIGAVFTLSAILSNETPA